VRALAILGADLEVSLARVENALKRMNNYDVLIVSGKDVAEKMAEYARRLGCEKEIVIDNFSTSTYENAKNVRRIALEKGIEKIYVATSSYHIPSVKIIFEKAFNNFPFELISLPSSKIFRSVAKEILSIIQDVPSIYLLNVLEKDYYDKTLGRIKRYFFRMKNAEKSKVL